MTQNFKHYQYVRQKFCTIFYLLTYRHKQHSLGYELTDTEHGEWCFPTSDFYSSRVLELMDPDRINRCIEYISNFLAAPEASQPYLIQTQMAIGREEFSKYIKGDCKDIQTRPMVFLAWLIWSNFKKNFLENVENMFPLYAKDWKHNYEVLKSYSPRDI